MNRAKWIWLASLGLIYASFWIWYGGNGDPISEEEGIEMLAEVERLHGVRLEDTPEGSMSRNLRAMLPHDDGKECYAVNLETRATGPEAIEAEAEYGAIVIPLLLERGGHPVFVSERAGLMLGKYGEEIDRVAVVRYRSLRDLLDMIADERMLEGKNKFRIRDSSQIQLSAISVFPHNVQHAAAINIALPAAFMQLEMYVNLM